ncbi:MAG: tRNA 2-thiouridine(34) synthase MnmA [Patescibacteria group bacterium]
MKSVFVGLSGGVDSAVSAYLLQKEGYAVTGVFIRIWQPEFLECTWEQDRLDAKRVASALSIPFRELDLSHIYKETVIADMVSAYAQGQTPNPDVLCNRAIKFGAFATWALEQGADFVATGHYARIETGGSHRLLRGVDRAKDQAYFLWQVRMDQLAHILFPVGGFPKSETRAIALANRLPVARRADSQGLCFIGAVDLGDFLARFISMRDGEVVDTEGRIVGVHRGVSRYTKGQRHGFQMNNAETATEPHFVVQILPDENKIVVSTNIRDAMSDSCQLANCNWLQPIPENGVVHAEARYHQTPIPARVEQRGNDATLYFTEPAILSVGQSVVMYQGDVVIGGGIIT